MVLYPVIEYSTREVCKIILTAFIVLSARMLMDQQNVVHTYVIVACIVMQ